MKISLHALGQAKSKRFDTMFAKTSHEVIHCDIRMRSDQDRLRHLPVMLLSACALIKPRNAHLEQLDSLDDDSGLTSTGWLM